MTKRKIYNAIDCPELWKPILAGKRVGLITNPSGVDRELRLTSDILFENGSLVCLFSPEHGVRGDKQAGHKIFTYTDELTNLPVYSLYGSGNGHIAPEIICSLDAVAFDIQDVGARFYTYIYTLAAAMEDCAAHSKEMIVFDRLNPLGGVKPQGTVLDPAFSSGVGRYPIATRFNLTVGEYAKFINETQNINCNLTVIPLKGWWRDCIFQDTDLCWIPPSPNLPTIDSSFCYIGTCLFEGTNLSEGRGTAKPFETVGAPWLNARETVAHMNSLSLPGVRFSACHFTPTFSKHCDLLCHGIRLHITDTRLFKPFETGLLLVDCIRKSHKEFSFLGPDSGGRYFIDLLLGSDALRREGFDPLEFIETQNIALAEYEVQIKKYYLYS